MSSERDFEPPVEATEDGWRFNLENEERDLLIRLLGELKTLLTSDENETTKPLLHRLFPPAFLDDEEKEAEYQRLMREELVASRVASVDTVIEILGRSATGTHNDLDGGNAGRPADGDTTSPLDRESDGAILTENETLAFMQSLNAVRLVLGTMLDITDDDAADLADLDDSAEHHLYGYLGWLLEWTVRSLTPG